MLLLLLLFGVVCRYPELKIRLRRFARLGEKRRHKNSGTIVDGKENSQREAQFASGKLERKPRVSARRSGCYE